MKIRGKREGRTSMKLYELVEDMNFEVVCGSLENEVSRGYTGDLLSEVMGNASGNSIWVTVQSHPNIVAVAVLTGIKAIVLTNGREYDEETVEKAKKEGIVLLKSQENSFVVSGKLYEKGIR